MSFGEKILDYKEEIIADLSELIAIQSVSGIQDSCKEALDWMMRKARRGRQAVRSIGAS